MEDTRISDGVYLSSSGVIRVGRVTGQDARVNPGELGMVPGIEGLRPELEPKTFFDLEVFVQRQVPVVAARAFHDVLGRITPRERSRLGERAWTEPLLKGMRISDRPHLVSMVGGAAAEAEIVVGCIDAQRISGLHEHHTGECPSSRQGLGKPVRILEEGHVVVKVDDRDVPPVEAGCPVLVTRVHWIVEIVKELGIDHIPGVREGIRSAHREVMPRSGLESGLQSIVVGVALIQDQVDARKAQIRPVIVGIVAAGGAAIAAANVNTVRIVRRHGVDVGCLGQVKQKCCPHNQW